MYNPLAVAGCSLACSCTMANTTGVEEIKVSPTRTSNGTSNQPSAFTKINMHSGAIDIDASKMRRRPNRSLSVPVANAPAAPASCSNANVAPPDSKLWPMSVI